MKITFIRHTSVDVPPGTCYGWSDVPLAPTFTEEARHVQKNLTGMDFDRVYTSPLTRCRRLAAYCGYPHAIPDSRLKEMNFGEWEMQAWETIRDPHLQDWFEDWLHLPATGGRELRGPMPPRRRLPRRGALPACPAHRSVYPSGHDSLRPNLYRHSTTWERLRFRHPLWQHPDL